jgi:ATP-binding cassette, subfamily C, bacterial
MKTPPPLGVAARFARELVYVLRWRLVPAIGLPLLLGATEGAGIMLLVPLLGEIGLDVDGGVPGRLAAATGAAFESLGLPLTLVTVLAAVVVVSGLHAALAHWQLLLHPALDRVMLSHYRTRLYDALVHAQWSYAVQARVGDRVHAVMTDVQHVSMLAYQVFTITAGVALLVVYVAFAARLSLPVTLLVLSVGCVLLVLQRAATRRSSLAAERYAEGSAALHQVANESLAGLKTVRSYGAEARTLARVRLLDGRMAHAYNDVMRGYARTKLWFDAGSTAGLVVVLYGALAFVQVTTATLVLLLLLFARLLPRVATLQAGVQQFRAALPGFARALALMDAHEAHREPRSTMPAPRVAREIRFDAVTFRYAPAGPDVLQDVRLSIPVGRTTAITGVSGSGKSTLADLLMGLLSPVAGHVLVDDARLQPESAAAWRSQVAYVAQDPVLFDDTIRENLLWAVPDASEAQMRAALADAAADFVWALPAGLETPIGDRGARLSGGERQRIALARALLRAPSVLVLDEATSALDAEHELRIQQAIERLHGRITIVLITHRLATVRHADVIHVIEAGRLIETGTWSDLLARPRGRFRDLCAAQHVHDAVAAAT